jgi:predicted ATPase
MLLDRLPERAALSQLLDAARAGRSGVLVMRGEPGIGKTEPHAGYIFHEKPPA